MAPSQRGLSAKLTGGVSYPKKDTPSDPLMRATSPYGGGKTG